jgi:hypothetical protein
LRRKASRKIHDGYRHSRAKVSLKGEGMAARRCGWSSGSFDTPACGRLLRMTSMFLS